MKRSYSHLTILIPKASFFFFLSALQDQVRLAEGRGKSGLQPLLSSSLRNQHSGCPAVVEQAPQAKTLLFSLQFVQCSLKCCSDCEEHWKERERKKEKESYKQRIESLQKAQFPLGNSVRFVALTHMIQTLSSHGTTAPDRARGTSTKQEGSAEVTCQ